MVVCATLSTNEFILIMTYSAQRSSGSRSEHTTRDTTSRHANTDISAGSVINGIRPTHNLGNIQPRVDAQASQELRQPAVTSASFPSKLHHLVGNSSHQEIISWDRNGRSFTIHDTLRLEEEVLGTYFKTSKLRSFFRQLSAYAFKRPINRQPTFFHIDFIRGNTFNSDMVQRVKIKGPDSRTNNTAPTLEDIAALPPAPTTSSSKDSQISADADVRSQSKRASKSAANDQCNRSTKKLKTNPYMRDGNATLVQEGDVINNNYANESPPQQRVTSNPSDFIVDHTLIDFEHAGLEALMDFEDADFHSLLDDPIFSGRDDQTVEATGVNSFAYNQYSNEIDPLLLLSESSLPEENLWHGER